MRRYLLLSLCLHESSERAQFNESARVGVGAHVIESGSPVMSLSNMLKSANLSFLISGICQYNFLSDLKHSALTRSELQTICMRDLKYSHDLMPLTFLFHYRSL